MATRTEASTVPVAVEGVWYAQSCEAVAAMLDVDPTVGLSADRAADLSAKNGPNALPDEKQQPGWRRFLAQYRSYMQLILCGAAVVSLLVREWSTAVLLVFLTVLNAVVGLRQEGNQPRGCGATASRRRPPQKSWWSAMSS